MQKIDTNSGICRAKGESMVEAGLNPPRKQLCGALGVPVVLGVEYSACEVETGALFAQFSRHIAFWYIFGHESLACGGESDQLVPHARYYVQPRSPVWEPDPVPSPLLQGMTYLPSIVVVYQSPPLMESGCACI